jgi:hypothetical protein
MAGDRSLSPALHLQAVTVLLHIQPDPSAVLDNDCCTSIPPIVESISLCGSLFHR